MLIAVDPASPDPPFEQVRAQIAELARTGALPPETRLPTVRSLAENLGLAANTVARAYRELEADAVVETRGRHGTFIAASGDPAHREAVSAAHAYAQRVRRLGVPQAEALTLIEDALRAQYAPPPTV
jgi:DNA-binding transcriptional regulator YhcF (GntR family)